MPVAETREYIIEDPLHLKKPIKTQLRSKAKKYFQQNYHVTEKQYVEIMVSPKEAIGILRVKIW